MSNESRIFNCGASLNDTKSRVWCCTLPEFSQEFVWTDGDEALVFQHDSGETHLLNLVDRTTLECLAQIGPVTIDTLCAEVAAILEVDDKQALNRYIKKLLEQFDELGLAKPVTE